MPNDVPATPTQVCECGCAESYTPAKPWQRFKSREHSDRYWYDLRQKAKELNRTAISK